MVTVKDLEEKIEKVSEETGLNLSLDRWSPGDGWTRNQLFVSDENDSLTHQISEVMKTREMYKYLEGYLEINRAIEINEEE